MTQTIDAITSHPAKFSNSVLAAASPWISEESSRLGRSLRILDPFAGVGKVHTFQDQGHETVGIELEPEWGSQHASNIIGNALDLSFLPHESFDIMLTSPCYANRMADHHDAKDSCGVCGGSGKSIANTSTKSVMAGTGTCSGCKGTGLSRRNTYTHQLGRKLHEDNSGQLQWGQKYRTFHEKVWAEANTKIRPGGLFIVNISNHIRSGQEQPVLEWHLGFFMQDLGMLIRAVEPVRTPRNRDGKNADLRVDHEFLLVLRKRTSGS